MDKLRKTALIRASRAGHLEVVSVLLEAKADVEALDLQGQIIFNSI